MKKYLLILMLAGSVFASDPSDTLRLYDGSISTHQYKRYPTAYGYDEAGTDSIRIDGWQGECYYTIVCDSHATSWGARGTNNFQWQFTLGAQPSPITPDTMRWTFAIHDNNVDYIRNTHRWSAMSDSAAWGYVIVHADHRQAGVGCWNWYQADGDYYEYANGVLIQILRPRFVEDDEDISWGVLFIDAANDSLTVSIDSIFLDTADYPVTVELNTFNEIGGFLTDEKSAYGYDMAGEGQAGPYVIFNGTDNSVLYNYHLYTDDDAQDTGTGPIHAALYSSNNSASGAYDDTIALSALDYRIYDRLIPTGERSHPSLETMYSDDNYVLSTGTVYWVVFGAQTWLMYNLWNNIQVSGGCDTCMKSKWQIATTPPLENPFSDDFTYENKWGMFWCTYYEPGWDKPDTIAISNTAMTGVTIAQ